MPIGAHRDLTGCRQFFLRPRHAKQRMYEALRAFFVEGKPSKEVAHSFGYTPGSFRVLCHSFRRQSDPAFFAAPHPSRFSPRRSKSRDLAVALRKQNYSVYEISETLKEQKMPLSPSGVRKVLTAEGFAPLPRRLDEERPDRAHRQRPQLLDGATQLHHPVRWALPALARSGAISRREAGGGGKASRLEDDPCDPRAARLPFAQALVGREKEPRYVPRRRRGLGSFLRAQCHSEEELPIRVFLTRGSTPHSNTFVRLARADRG